MRCAVSLSCKRPRYLPLPPSCVPVPSGSWSKSSRLMELAVQRNWFRLFPILQTSYTSFITSTRGAFWMVSPADAPDEPLTGASPLVDLSIESGKLLIRQMDDDLVAYPIRRGKVYQRAQDRNLHHHAGALTASGCQQNGAAEHLLQRNKPQDGNWSHRAEGVRTVDFCDTLTAIL